MKGEQLAHKFWLSLDKLQGKEVAASVEGAMLAAKVKMHDAFSCVFESLSLRWETGEEWDKLVEKCEKGLKALHKDFALVERDDLNRLALYRSALSRDIYWEAQLKCNETNTLTVNRYKVQVEGKRFNEPFVLTEEQLAEFVSGVLND